MFIVVRVRWEATPATAVWSDDEMRAWLNPDVEWSLAHCWSRSSFRQITLKPYYLSPVVVMDGDPRTNPAYAGLAPRDALTQGVMDALPPEILADNAEAIASGRARMLFCFAQQTDLFGSRLPDGGVPTGHAVCDVLSPFSMICQEVGHAYGFDHELADKIEADGRYKSYGSQYSFMSAWSNEEHLRPVVNGLPVGQPNPALTQEPQRYVGPQLPLAQLHFLNVGAFVNPQTCLTTDYDALAAAPVEVSIAAADDAVSAWPERIPALIVIPHTPVDDRAYYIEFRTRVSYDSNIAGPAVVMHSWRRSVFDGDYTADRLVYEGAVVAGAGDTDLKAGSGAIAIQPRFDLANGRAVVRIGTGGAFDAAGASLAEGPDYQEPKIGEGAWRAKYGHPCPYIPGRSYSARPTWHRTECRVAVSASGYDSPHFRFYLGGKELTASLGGLVTATALVEVLDEPALDKRQASQGIVTAFTVAGNVLTLSTAEPCNGSVTVGVSVEEAADGSARRDTHHLFAFSFRNARIEWDPDWLHDVATCLSRRPEHVPVVTFPWEIDDGPRPNWHGRVLEVLERVNERNPVTARLLVQGLSERSSLDPDLLGQLGQRWGPLG